MLAVAALGYWGILDLEHANAKQLQRIELLRVHLEADMAHDAIRADVLDAILLGLNKREINGLAPDISDAREKGIKEGFRQHARAIQEGLTRLVEPSNGVSIFAAGTQADLERYITYAATIIDDAVADPTYARTRLSGFLELFGALEKSMAAVSGEIERLANEAKREAETEAQWNKQALVGASLAAGIIGFLIAYGLTRSITRPLGQAVRVAKAVAAGDLTQGIEVKSKDEIGHLMQCFADMNRSLNGRMAHLAGEIRQSSQTILDASDKLVWCSANLSERTESQASTMEETAASIEQLSSAVKQNADNAAEANRLADVASKVAGKGGEATANVVNTMRQIHSRSLKISDIISVMDGIAFQTNILALNAAVEAARAGEQGRGFAVVAAEVRNLALRSADSAKEVKSLIEGTVREIETASKVADEAGQTVGVTVKNTHAVTTLMSEIAIASREQSDSIEQMALAVVQVERASEKNADLVQDAGTMAEELSHQAGQLMNLLKDFKLDDAKMHTASGATRPRALGRDTSVPVGLKVTRQLQRL